MTTGGPLIEARGVWRRYRLARSAHRGTLRASLLQGPRAFRHEWIWALREIDLDLAPGETLGVIGPNGAGKSTLLRLIGGVGRPDRGTVRVQGRVGALLDLGREFHPDLTGRQNAEVAAVVAGLRRAEFGRRFDEIVDFSGLARFVDQPLHTYSDGMRARLALSVALHVDPDVLLVDEVLGVGDASFQHRSADRMRTLAARGTGVLLVSHDLSLVRELCEKVAWLEQGRIRTIGPAADVVGAYLHESAPSVVVGRQESDVLSSVAVCDAWAVPTGSIRSGDGLVVTAGVDRPADHPTVMLSVKIRRPGLSVPVVDTSTPITESEVELRVAFDRLDLAPGSHEVVVAVFSAGWDTLLGEHRSVLQVSGQGPDHAAMAPPHEWTRR